MAPTRKPLGPIKRHKTPAQPAQAAQAARPETRLPGGPTPQSAAATNTYYDPNGMRADNRAAPQSALGEAHAHAQAVRDQAINVGPTDPSVDASVLNNAPEGEETYEQQVARIRALRRPLGSFKQKLAYEKRPGYHRHWFNDSPGRVDEAEANGWAFVRGKDGKPVNRNVDRGRDNKGQSAYLMELPEVIWQEDMAARHRDAQERMNGIKANPFRSQAGESKPEDSGKYYSPIEAPLTIERR